MGLDEAKNAIVKVGGGRGFVVQGERDRLVITAGHCLPDFPTCHSSSHTEERTYKALLGSLGEKPAVWAECLFADPIGDVAVLGPPDDQQPSDEFEAYETSPKTGARSIAARPLSVRVAARRATANRRAPRSAPEVLPGPTCSVSSRRGSDGRRRSAARCS